MGSHVHIPDAEGYVTPRPPRPRNLSYRPEARDLKAQPRGQPSLNPRVNLNAIPYIYTYTHNLSLHKK